MTTPARKTQLPVTHEISKTINFSDANVTSGLLVGVIPAGSMIRSIDLFITTAFNAGTTNTLSVGTAAAGTQFVNATAAGSAALTVTACPIAVAAPASDTSVYITYGTSGTAATAGVATVVVTYFPNIG